MIYRFLVFTLLAFSILSCGSDDEKEMEQEMEIECGGDLVITLNGSTKNFGKPFSATYVELDGATEFIAVWLADGENLSIQTIIADADPTCHPLGLLDSEVISPQSVFLAFTYVELDLASGAIIASYSNSDNSAGSGFFDVKDCDDDNNRISFDFGFNLVTTAGDDVIVPLTSVSNVCFARTK